MIIEKLFDSTFQEHEHVVLLCKSLIPSLIKITEDVVAHMQKSSTLFFMGNGGSAADSQHMAAELIGRFKKERPAIASIALTTDSSILTSLGNDYDYSIIFARQLEALAKKQDVIIGMSTSGNSLNVIKGFQTAKQKSCLTICLTGESGGDIYAQQNADYIIRVPSKNTARIQEMHTIILHTICEAIESALII